MALSAQFVNAKDLRKAIGEINSTGLVDPKIKTVGVKKEVMLQSFIEKMGAIPEADEDKLAESTITFYNKIMTEEDPSPEEQAKAEAAKKKPKEPKGPSNEQKGYDLMKAGASDDEWNKVFGEFYAKKGVTDQEFIKKRIAIYKNIAKKKLAKEGTPVEEPAKKEKAVKKAAPKKAAPKKEPAEETPPAEKPAEETTETEPVTETEPATEEA